MKYNKRQLSADTALQIVSSPKRRVVLEQLIGSDEKEVPVPELVDAVTAASTDGSSGVDDEEREATAIELRHVHLPKLAAEQIIRYDAKDGVVRYRGRSDVEALVEFVAETFA